MLSSKEGLPMSRRRVSGTNDLKIIATFVVKRDGRQRVEMAVRLLLEPPSDCTDDHEMKNICINRLSPAPPATPDRSTDRESSTLRPRLDPAAGPGPDD